MDLDVVVGEAVDYEISIGAGPLVSLLAPCRSERKSRARFRVLGSPAVPQ